MFSGLIFFHQFVEKKKVKSKSRTWKRDSKICMLDKNRRPRIGWAFLKSASLVWDQREAEWFSWATEQQDYKQRRDMKYRTSEFTF